ncbi:hypothetical protein DH2020_038045 [Rehmannia glutinosa]|uniref:Glutamate decarboxylase n=1 Tax=Rehmannia glutinosa TaxID=99300 RepID=A0ABR0V008_REHGL
MPKEAAYQIVNDELMLDGNPRLNLASFVTTWMEPECDKLIMASINKNYVDMDEYPNRCVNMIAHLFHAPVGDDETAVGVGTVGSSEAIMLAGLAFKRKWQAKRKAQGKPYDKPNIVTGANVQVCWEKFARYFEVELKEVKLREGYYVMDQAKAVEMVDENTICVAAILGSTLTGEFEDVKLLNELLTKKNKETGWDTPIHVDAASGGFIAPFLCQELEWDFRLPLVKSINVSGHKYGLVYAGVGWVVWRSKEDLPEELVFHINYLGSDQPTFTLNFSKGSPAATTYHHTAADLLSPAAARCSPHRCQPRERLTENSSTISPTPNCRSEIHRASYNSSFTSDRLVGGDGDGYKNIMENCMENARLLKEGITKTGHFEILSKDIGVPLVAFSLKDSSRYTVFQISESLRRFGWIVPAYTMSPNAEHIAVLRVVIREDFSHTLAERLVFDIEKVVKEFDELPPHASVKTAHVTLDNLHRDKGDSLNMQKSIAESQKEICSYWRRISDKKTSGVC